MRSCLLSIAFVGSSIAATLHNYQIVDPKNNLILDNNNGTVNVDLAPFIHLQGLQNEVNNNRSTIDRYLSYNYDYTTKLIQDYDEAVKVGDTTAALTLLNVILTGGVITTDYLNPNSTAMQESKPRYSDYSFKQEQTNSTMSAERSDQIQKLVTSFVAAQMFYEPDNYVPMIGDEDNESEIPPMETYIPGQ